MTTLKRHVREPGPALLLHELATGLDPAAVPAAAALVLVLDEDARREREQDDVDQAEEMLR